MTTQNNTTTISIRAIAAAPVAVATSAAIVVAETGAAITRIIAGEDYDKVVLHNFIESHTTGSIFSDMWEEMEEEETKKEETEKSPLTDHSDKVEWSKWHWVCSAAYIEAQKKAGKEAILPSLYKASNGLINFAKYGKGDPNTQYKGVSYACRIYAHIANHAAWLRDEKGVKNAMEQLEAFYKEACWLSMVAEDKLPAWEDIKAAAEEALKNGAKEEAAETKEEVKAEAREGRAPKTEEPEEALCRKYNEVIKVIGVPAIRSKNAKEAAEKARVALNGGLITRPEYEVVIKKASSKFPEGSEEEAQILSYLN